MIISISGKISSGKDTIGKIIQYLVWKSRVEKGELPLSVYSFSDFSRETFFGKNQSNFEIKKFADALKQFIADSTGCTREQLEDREFKEKELGEEWWTYAFYRENTRKPLRFYSTLQEAEKDLKIFKGGRIEIIKPTYRSMFTSVGTDAIRNHVHPNYWVNALMSKYKMSYVQHKEIKYVEHKQYPNWVITDTRFPNELKAVKSRGGITIRVDRFTSIKNDLVYFKNDAGDSPINGIYRVLEVKKDNCTLIDDKTGYSFGAWFEEISKIKEHESETALDNAEFDYTIENNGTIEDLIHTVSLILKREKII